MPLSKKYEQELDRQIRKALKEIRKIYNKAIDEVTMMAYLHHRKISGTLFQLNKEAFLKKEINRILKGMSKDVQKAVIKAITEAWDLSNNKNDQITTQQIQKIYPEIPVAFNHNLEALKAFTNRVDHGMNLSKRVWRLTKAYRFELEAGLTDGINKGRSAASMATDMKKHLRQPNKLFRRVRDKNGKLQLSRAAKNYHPGQGIYRSSFQNAVRLTASETNMAYRTADHVRWKNDQNIKGMEVKTSNNHPKFDECDHLAGKYPKGFLFRGWHPRCRCYAVPILVSDEEFNQMEDVLLGLSKKAPKIKEIERIPSSARNWISENAERIKGWKNKPYWVTDNPKYVNL